MRYGVELKKTDKFGRQDERHVVRDIEPDDWDTTQAAADSDRAFKESIGDPFFADAGI